MEFSEENIVARVKKYIGNEFGVSRITVLRQSEEGVELDLVLEQRNNDGKMETLPTAYIRIAELNPKLQEVIFTNQLLAIKEGMEPLTH